MDKTKILVNVRTHPPPTGNLMASEKKPKGPADDIGSYVKIINSNESEGSESSAIDSKPFKSDRKRILDDIHDTLGSHQVASRKLAFAPPWIVEQAFDREHVTNWSDAYVKVPERSVPINSNLITSHVLYKVNTDERDGRDLQVGIVPHGNRDDEKDRIRKDSATAQLKIICLLLSVVTFLGFWIGMADIKGAYLQSVPIKGTYMCAHHGSGKVEETCFGILQNCLMEFSRPEDNGRRP